MKYVKPLLLIAAALSFAACSDAEIAERDTQAAFSLTIAHINDTHSSFDPVASSFNANEMRVYNEFGGHPRILERANQYRAEAEAANQPMLFLHGGDAWQGSAYFKLNEGRMNADILSRMQLDAMALGNHEFDLTNAHLNEFLSSVNFPMLAANVDASGDEDLNQQSNLLPYVVFAFNGFQKQRLTPEEPPPENQQLVAVFGLALDDMPNIAPNTGDLVFANMVETAQAMVDEFHAMGIDKVVALTHIGKAIDVEIANQVNGIDVIVGGHSHTLLGDFSDLSMGYAGTYAEWVINPDGESATCVVQAGEYAQAIGRVEIDFTRDGRVLDCVGGNTLLSNDTFYRDSARTEDSYLGGTATAEVLDFIAAHPRLAVVDENTSMRAHIDAVYRPAMERAYGTELGMVPAEITHIRTPTEAYPTGSEVAPLVALGQYQWAASEEVVAITGLQADFALVGAGGVRQSLAQGLLREGDITLELLPFANFISIVPLTGAHIIQLLQDTVGATVPAGSHAGKFPYGGNMRYRFDVTQPGVEGEIVSVEINRGTLLEPEWQAIEAEAIYNVAMNSYNATGNDGWNVLYEAQKESSNRVDLAYVEGELSAFAVERIQRTDDGRLQVIYESAALQCDIAGVACNTDAMAVVEFFRDIYVPLRGAVLPLPYGVVEWNLPDSEESN
ncbi:bifunctional metallophosphatase/5'-nucleotidase [Aliidiomarina iranensis]|uniref:Bifunctional metallophosphatase/5'-nucleotidase n=1 Tax=Aliidiomarina iranensis TaxID=1434071 RepID=A0A432VW63_9GAMM|nr:bifunctional metallophosphatase/5'-nucleotidase [Aliidiomarina iranensis]RUO20827.1 bifunctional metallophosphatase/5'-nucleotidase [Aliidiomarina iranensis]